MIPQGCSSAGLASQEMLSSPVVSDDAMPWLTGHVPVAAQETKQSRLFLDVGDGRLAWITELRCPKEQAIFINRLMVILLQVYLKNISGNAD